MAFSWGSSNNNNNNNNSNNNTSNGFSWGNNNTPNSGTGGGGGFGANNNNNTNNNSNNNNNNTSFFGGFGGNNSNQQQGEGWNAGNNNNQNNNNNNSFSFGGGNNNNNNNGNSWSMNNNNNTNTNNNNAINPNNDHVVVNPPSDAISNVQFHPNSAQFIVSSWDNSISVYEFFGGNTKKLGQQKHDKPILDCCYDVSGDTIYSAGCDNVVKIWNPQQNNFANIGQHQAPIRCVQYSGNSNMLITGSWDRTCSFWDKRNAGTNNIKPVHSINLGFRVYAMAQKGNYLVVALSNNDIKTFDLRNGAKEQHSTKQELSTNTKAVVLKKQIRCIDIFPDGGGYCAASVGGRVIIKHFNRSISNKDFSYKCHRAAGSRNGTSHVFGVNALKFHQQSSVFATAGDDGTIVTWDKDGRAKLVAFKELQLKNYRNNSGNSNSNITLDRMPVVALDYHSNGQYMIYASSYNWNKGQEFHDLQQQRPQIYLHQVQQKEIDKGKK